MKLIDTSTYHKLEGSLQRVAINTFFARSVIEQKVNGKIFADDPENPKSFYALHPYGMSLLFGASNNVRFNNRFREYALNTNQVRDKHEWMQAGSRDWDPILRELFGSDLIKSADNIPNKETGIVELNTRVNFEFHRDKFQRPLIGDNDIKIVRTDKQIFRDMKGSVVPHYFWENEDIFLSNGIGFSLLYRGELASTAYSAFIHDDKLEIGIETLEAFRGKGFAELACAALIDYCITNNYEPVWACRLENTGSYKLAYKVGFAPALQIPYYRLSK